MAQAGDLTRNVRKWLSQNFPALLGLLDSQLLMFFGVACVCGCFAACACRSRGKNSKTSPAADKGVDTKVKRPTRSESPAPDAKAGEVATISDGARIEGKEKGEEEKKDD